MSLILETSEKTFLLDYYVDFKPLQIYFVTNKLLVNLGVKSLGLIEKLNLTIGPELSDGSIGTKSLGQCLPCGLFSMLIVPSSTLFRLIQLSCNGDLAKTFTNILTL